MKIREGFVSNSSSSSFIFTNTSDKKISRLKFMAELAEYIKALYITERAKDSSKVEYYNECNTENSCVAIDDSICQMFNEEEYECTNEGKEARKQSRYFKPNKPVTVIIRMDGDGGTVAENIFGHCAPEKGHTDNFKWEYKERY